MLRTTRQEKILCKSCPLAKVAHIFGDTSILLIIRDLLNSSKRFKDLETSLSGVSSRTIALKLKFLEEKGIVSRAVYKEKPPKVEYSLTQKGHALHKITEEMRAYGKKYL